jgi:murein DD-endopeptidase MepM/ murein hydrolase activator NlpD
MRALTAAFLLLVGVGLGVALAGDVFRWRDGGFVRETPRPAASVPPLTSPPADPSAAAGEHTPIAGLRFEYRDDAIEAWVDNHLAGPIEVVLRPIDSDVRGASPELPARAVVPALERRIVTRLPVATTARFHLDVMRGTPNARAEDVEYAFPLDTRSLRIEQGWGGAYSHRDAENRYGIDFAAEIGTPVLAARAGTVMELEAGYARSGANNPDALGRANYVRILHDDGTMGLYAHLDTGGVRVRIGQRVRQGEVIGLSGDTGYTSGPHLHFAVQINRGMTLESIPFRMFGPEGILRFDDAR